MKTLIAVAATLLCAVSTMTGASEPSIEVYKSPTCGCCGKWVKHLEANGFKVKAHDVDDVSVYKERFGVPVALGACHTAKVGDYAIEGHVPAEDIKRLLKERPKVKGIGVAGMPAGSPGMESPHPERYEVKSFDLDGALKTFAKH
ncbi:MAG TPA: DUF411 domain-containing protein [Burkholderiales bacterium]|nr:DUF411 domain-containing protein [Burkholderiales bacterium]